MFGIDIFILQTTFKTKIVFIAKPFEHPAGFRVEIFIYAFVLILKC